MAGTGSQPEELHRLLQDPGQLQQALQSNPQGFINYFQDLLARGINQPQSTLQSGPDGDTPIEPSTATTSSIKSEKHPDPPIFDGNPLKWREFKTQLRVKLLINSDRYPSPQSRLAYTISRLQGNPLSIITPRIIRGIIMFNDYEDLLESLDTAYEDPNIRIKAQRELRTLK